MYILVLVLVLYILFKFTVKENFIVDTIKENKDRLTDRLSINKTLTTKYTDETDSIPTVLSKSGYSFFNVDTIYPITNTIELITKTNPKSEISSDPLAYNDDFKYEDEVIGSKNVEIDNNIIKMLNNIKDVIVDTNLPEITNSIEGNSSEFRSIEFVDNKEVEYIIRAFTNYLNNKTSYLFSYLEIGKVELSSSSIKNSELQKKYKISFFIYENSITYTKRLKINFLTKQYNNRKGILIVENIEIPKDATLETKPLLPPAKEPIDLNTITDSDINYKIENKLGLMLPFKTNETDMIITEEDFKKELERQKLIQKLKQKYTCFGIPQSELIDNQEECLDFGGVWDKPVEDNTMCPFYNSNKNYINNRGGVKGDYCEMPSGLEIIGYSHYDEDPNKSRPICYNCKTELIGQGTMGYCCQEQKLDTLKYPGFKSPDYKFPGDQLDRYNSRNELELSGLSIN